jgi:hypothetical protein
MGAPAGTPLTPTQLRVFDELLAVGGTRPVAPAGLVDEITRLIVEGTSDALGRWQESSLWQSKAGLSAVRRCEGQVLADHAQGRRAGIGRPTAIGLVVHRAIQLAHTHPDRSPEALVRAAVAGCRAEDQFADFWDAADDSTQSDVIVEAVNRLCGYLDSFPPLEASWVPRFEDSTVARLRRLTLAARPDLTLGRPRGDGRQTMFLTDFKSGELRDSHFDEAMFYALVATLRHGCPPFRSCVISLSSGEWTDPDVTSARLVAAAEQVVAGVTARVDVLTEARPPTLTPGHHCGWCPARATCPGAAAWEEAGRPVEHAIALPGDGVALGRLVGDPPDARPTEAPASAGSSGVAAPVGSELAGDENTGEKAGGGGDNPWLVD